MNTVQRLLSNTVLAFISSIVVKAGNALLFILIGRWLGPSESGAFSLATTYYTFVFGLSALGLHEIMVRDLPARRDESGRYLVNYVTLRLLLSIIGYGLLLLGLRLFSPYSETTTQTILILSLAVIPEAVFSICQSLFEAHERLVTPMLAAIASSGIKLLAGFWLLSQGAQVAQIAWVIPIASAASLIVFAPGLARLFRRAPQRLPARLDGAFLRLQLSYTPSFFVIQLFSLLDYQADALLISLMLSEEALGHYTAAQTILLAFNLMPLAIRTAVYPLMSRYYHEAPDKLAVLYDKSSRYLFALVLPLATGVTLLAAPIIALVFGPGFEPAVPVLQISIWAIVFLFLNVPHARLLLIHHKQREAARMLGAVTLLNVALNLILIPRAGIVGAAVARLLSSFALYASFYAYTEATVMRLSMLPALARPLLANALMAAVVWWLRAAPLPIPIAAGGAVYAAAALLLGIVPPQDVVYWREIIRRRG
jgi:O-antigen/teichoic acid export membrane protein